MTTDTVKKEIAVSLTLGGKEVKLGAIAKGSGMIHPNMGTMLCFITTDCAITHEMLEDALREVVSKTFNRVTVDGDTSTNDTCLVLANGMANNTLIEWKDEDYEAFKAALDYVCRHLARAIAGDGEGASRLVTCKMTGARSEDTAERLAKAVVGSSLVKAAMFGADANWGRVLCAMGYSKAPFRPEHVDISFRSEAGEVLVCQQGDGLPFDEDKAKKILSQQEVVIAVDLHEGDESAECWGCDLTYDYVKINGDYRT
jgi:glutamate N-acetyltransferase/amino-acid N-acetyltransferase